MNTPDFHMHSQKVRRGWLFEQEGCLLPHTRTLCSHYLWCLLNPLLWSWPCAAFPIGDGISGTWLLRSQHEMRPTNEKLRMSNCPWVLERKPPSGRIGSVRTMSSVLGSTLWASSGSCPVFMPWRVVCKPLPLTLTCPVKVVPVSANPSKTERLGGEECGAQTVLLEGEALCPLLPVGAGMSRGLRSTFVWHTHTHLLVQCTHTRVSSVPGA